MTSAESGEPGTLERIQAQIDEDRDVGLDRAVLPAVGLVDNYL